MTDLLAVMAVLMAAMLVALSVGKRVGGRLFPRLLVAGVIVRLVGGEARLWVLEHVYGGIGDAVGYMGWGEMYADHIRNFEFAPLGEPAFGASFWGTHFLRLVAAFVQLFVGRSFHACTLIFSLFAYTGLVALALSFRRRFGHERFERYFALIAFWPSIFYWPSSVGKDAIMLLGLGLFVYGYSGREKLHWRTLLLGATLTTAIRPHITMVLVGAAALGEWLGREKSGQPNSLRVVVVSAFSAVIAYYSLNLFGLGGADLEGIQEQFETYAERTRTGGSQIAAVSGPLAIPMALVNVLLRPFPWEAHHVFALASGLEMWIVWAVVFLDRRSLAATMTGWRTSRFLSMTIFATFFIALMYGLAFANLGIIARQRVVILPFLFVPLALRTRKGVAVLHRPTPAEASGAPAPGNATSIQAS